MPRRTIVVLQSLCFAGALSPPATHASAWSGASPQLPASPVEAPAGDMVPPTERVEETPPAEQPPTEETPVEQPFEEETPSEVEPAPIDPPAPEPAATVTPEAALPRVDAKPPITDHARPIRIGGIATMASGGLLAITGLGLMVGFTVRGNRLANDLRNAEKDVFNAGCNLEPSGSGCGEHLARRDGVRDDLDRANLGTRVGGALLAVGMVAATVGGVVYLFGVRRRQQLASQRVRVLPMLGGAVVRGRF